MEKPIKISLKSVDSLAESPKLSISLNISEDKYNIGWENLFSVGARKNPKRDFLFVSKVIGKHLPINPMVLKVAGAILCRLWVEKRENIHDSSVDILVKFLQKIQTADIFEKANTDLINIDSEEIKNINKIINTPLNLKHKTLFVGFAETATGIAQSVFACSSNSYYIHTTREQIASVKQSVFFREEHSHATDHALYPQCSDIFEDADDIVLIDDELTTGKTALNLISNLPSDKNYGIISILDWRDKEWLNIFKEDKYKNIAVCSLLRGTIKCEKDENLIFKDIVENYSAAPSATHKDICFNEPDLIDGCIKYTGRFGLSNNKNQYIINETEKLASILKKERTDGNCLCLGTGEFIYIPCIISAELGQNVFFHSTTRSPIYSNNISGYPIRNKVTFIPDESSGIDNYIYNIPFGFYEQVFLFSEKSLSDKLKATYKAIFTHFNINNIVFVSWN